MTETPIRILLVDDHELIRSGLASVIDLEEDMAVVAVAGNVVEALTKYDELTPDVVIADLQLQDGTGLDIVRAVRKRSDAAEGPDNRMARALALRVGLSVTLFVLILLAYMLGWIEPSGVPLRP